MSEKWYGFFCTAHYLSARRIITIKTVKRGEKKSILTDMKNYKKEIKKSSDMH